MWTPPGSSVGRMASRLHPVRGRVLGGAGRPQLVTLEARESDLSEGVGPDWVLIASLLSLCSRSVQRSQITSGLFTIWLLSRGRASVLRSSVRASCENHWGVVC